MSFPISAPPSEPQIRGHFYWVLKGTLSLGYNSVLGILTLEEVSDKKKGLLKPGQKQSLQRYLLEKVQQWINSLLEAERGFEAGSRMRAAIIASTR